MKGNRALGKGLASLIPMNEEAPKIEENPKEESGYFQCGIQQIRAAKNQPRKLFSQKNLEELAASIKEQGILQPLIVRKTADHQYELIAGERRFRAAKLVGLTKVPVVVTQVVPEKVFELALIENIQRQDLNPIEEALAYRELQDKYAFTQEEIAKRVGKDRSSVANSLRLLGLPEEIRGDLIESKISMGHARALLSLSNQEEMIRLKRLVLLKNLSVRELEKLVKRAKAGITPLAPKFKSPQSANLQYLEDDLCKSIGTKVRIQGNNKKGKFIIEYFSQDELDRLYEQLSQLKA